MGKGTREVMKAVKATYPGEWSYEIRKTNHLKIIHAESGETFTTSSTPSDVRSLKNLKAEIRRRLG